MPELEVNEAEQAAAEESKAPRETTESNPQDSNTDVPDDAERDLNASEPLSPAEPPAQNEPGAEPANSAEPLETEAAVSDSDEPEFTGGNTDANDTSSLEEVIVEELVVEAPVGLNEDAQFKAIIEAAIYITDEPLTPMQIASALGQPAERVNRLLDELAAEYSRPERGLTIREIAGGYKMATKPEHHEAIRAFVKNLKPPLKLSLAALETLAVIAYKQPVTAPEIMEIRGVQGLGVLKTLLDRKLIATAGRKQVVGKPILYKTTKEFLVQFGLKDLSELPTLKEFEELGRLALTDEAPVSDAAPARETEPAPQASDPSQAPVPIEEPGPDEPPERDPDPTEEPGPPTDPEHQPVKGEQDSPAPSDEEPAA